MVSTPKVKISLKHRQSPMVCPQTWGCQTLALYRLIQKDITNHNNTWEMGTFVSVCRGKTEILCHPLVLVGLEQDSNFMDYDRLQYIEWIWVV